MGGGNTKLADGVIPCMQYTPGTEGVVFCTGTCNLNGIVWGQGPEYSGDSCACQAAKHAKVIGVKGGYFKVSVGDGKVAYEGSVGGCGIKSYDYLADQKSMTIIASQNGK